MLRKEPTAARREEKKVGGAAIFATLKDDGELLLRTVVVGDTKRATAVMKRRRRRTKRTRQRRCSTRGCCPLFPIDGNDTAVLLFLQFAPKDVEGAVGITAMEKELLKHVTRNTYKWGKTKKQKESFAIKIYRWG